MPAKKIGKPPVHQLTKSGAAAPRRRPGTIPPADVSNLPPASDAAATDLTTVTLDELPADSTVTLRPSGPRPAAIPAPPPRRGTIPPRSAAAAPATPRRPVAPAAGSSLRAMRGRVAQQVQVMDLTEEMAWIRSDLVRLGIMSVVGLVILIVLALVLPPLGL